MAAVDGVSESAGVWGRGEARGVGPRGRRNAKAEAEVGSRGGPEVETSGYIGALASGVRCATGNIVDTSDREHRLQLSPYGCLRVFRGFRVYSSSTGLRFA